ncbi:protein fra10ac1 [Nannochloropsis oceanica]
MNRRWGNDEVTERDHRALLRLAYPQHHRTQPQQITTDFDVLKRNFKFAWREGEDDDRSTWGARMAKRYFDKLHKEYVLADLSRWKEGKVGLRWRVEREVVDGTGQYTCGSLGVGCRAREGLASYELNFRYQEGGEVRNELVKIRVCERCKDLLDQARGGGGGGGGGKGRSSSDARSERRMDNRRKEEEEDAQWRRRKGVSGGSRQKRDKEGRSRGEDASAGNRKIQKQGEGKPTGASPPPPPPPPHPAAAAAAAAAATTTKTAIDSVTSKAAAVDAETVAAAAAAAAAEGRRKEKAAAAMQEMDDLIRDILDGKTGT